MPAQRGQVQCVARLSAERPCGAFWCRSYRYLTHRVEPCHGQGVLTSHTNLSFANNLEVGEIVENNEVIEKTDSEKGDVARAS